MSDTLELFDQIYDESKEELAREYVLLESAALPVDSSNDEASRMSQGRKYFVRLAEKVDHVNRTLGRTGLDDLRKEFRNNPVVASNIVCLYAIAEHHDTGLFAFGTDMAMALCRSEARRMYRKLKPLIIQYARGAEERLEKQKRQEAEELENNATFGMF